MTTPPLAPRSIHSLPATSRPHLQDFVAPPASHPRADPAASRISPLFFRLRTAAVLLLALVLATSCASTHTVRPSIQPPGKTRPLWVVGNGFHTAIVLRAPDAGKALRSLAPDPQAEWILIGWGQADFFLARRYSPLIFLKGAFLPGRSALHLWPLRRAPELVLPHSDVVRIEIPAEKIGDVRKCIAASFAHNEPGEPTALAAGYYPQSVFYEGRERFFFPRTCHFWCVQVLRSGGVNINPLRALTADDLIRQTAPHGERIGVRSTPRDGF